MSNFPTLDGLNNIDADSGNLTNITCETFIATTSAQAPTMIAGSSDNNVATTEFVTDAITNANYVTIDTTQTLTTGTKYFTNLPECATLATTANQFTNKQFVDNAVSGISGSYVTTGGTGTQTITSNKNFTGTNILGDVFSVDQPVKTSITNNTVSDTSVKGSIGGESIYHQMRMGGRGFYIGQGVTNSGRQYFAISGSGTPDPDVVMVMTENGVKVQNANVGDTTDYTEALKVIGTARVTGITTFDVPPVSATNPTTATQICNKQYTDAGNGASILPLNNTFTGNNTFNCATGTNIIQGNRVDIYPTITYLTSPTTTIAGTILNANSTQNWLNGDYTNLAGAIQTTMRSPTTLITGASCQYFTNQASIQTAFLSPSFLITNACTSFDVRATNTYLENSVVTATTQASSDNSTKLATTAFVNSYATANYMTLTGNQNVSGIKTYSTKQVFNAGTASSTYDNTSLTDMTIASNSTQGILSISGGKITIDTFGVRAGLGGNLQLNEGAFIESNPSLGFGSEPVFTFGLNQSGGYVDIPAVPRSAERTVRVDTGLIGFFCGNNQSTLFTITHSIVTTSSSGIGTMNEAEVYFYFVDNNTGITRYTTGNLATTTGFTLLPSSTYVRPTITFSLTTDTLPEGSYKIYGYSRVTNAYSLNAGFLSVNWNLASPISSITTTQDYNTPKDYTFTSRNLYHNFRNYVAGVYHVNVIAGQQNIVTPIFYSLTYYVNIFSQALQTGALTTPAVTGGTVTGSWGALSINNADNVYIVYPNYSIIVYNTQAWAGTIYLNFKNTTNNPVVVAPTTISAGSSCKIYFDEVELLPY